MALITTVVVSLLGVHGLLSGESGLRSALRSAGSAHELEAIASTVQDVNGNLYHALTLKGAQNGMAGASADLAPLLGECDRVIRLLAAWRDTQATPVQRPRVEALIVSMRRYKGAVDFVSQMLDVDFRAAVSFILPFDENFHDLMQSVDALVLQVQAQQGADAVTSFDISANTIRVFEAVAAVSVVLAVLAATNMSWAAAQSYRLTRQNLALKQLAQIDGLTSLANRRFFDEALARAWTECMAKQESLSLIIFDIDHFKKFNDSQGHQVGDKCLRQVAGVVAPCTRGLTDTVARYGGEEFVIILPNATLKIGEMIAERVRQAVLACAIPHPAAGLPGIVTVSLGVASLLPVATGDPAALIEFADRGLYVAKNGGRNRVAHAGALVEDPLI